MASRVVALEKMVAGLADCYRNASLLAEGLSGIDALSADVTTTKTNLVFCLDDGPCSAGWFGGEEGHQKRSSAGKSSDGCSLRNRQGMSRDSHGGIQARDGGSCRGDGPPSSNSPERRHDLESRENIPRGDLAGAAQCDDVSKACRGPSTGVYPLERRRMLVAIGNSVSSHVRVPPGGKHGVWL